MKYFCPNCRNKFKLRASYAGKRINCKPCGTDFDVASRIMALRQPGVTVIDQTRQLEAKLPHLSDRKADACREEIAKLSVETEDRLETYWRNWGELFGDVIGRPSKGKFLNAMDLLDVDYGIFRWRNSFQEYQLIEEMTAHICPHLLI
jgi:DNA-directed RNA polymerase subunit RPC12/RpoP